jgi:hypothetical protein
MNVVKKWVAHVRYLSVRVACAAFVLGQKSFRFHDSYIDTICKDKIQLLFNQLGTFPASGIRWLMPYLRAARPMVSWVPVEMQELRMTLFSQAGKRYSQ